jgi:hypothetical protein
MIEASQLSIAGSPEAAFYPSPQNSTVAPAAVPRESRTQIRNEPRQPPDPHPSPQKPAFTGTVSEDKTRAMNSLRASPVYSSVNRTQNFRAF